MSDRDAHGRFTEGNHPITGFHTNPERRNRFPTRGRAFQLAAGKYLDMNDEQIRTELAKGDALSQAQQLALQTIAVAKDVNNPAHLSALMALLDRTEGKPTVMEVETGQVEPPVINVQFVGPRNGEGESGAGTRPQLGLNQSESGE